MRIADQIWQNIEQMKNAVFMASPDKNYRFGDLKSAIESYWSEFDAAQAVKGDRALIVVSDEFAAIAGFMAAFLDGLVPVMLTADSRAPRVQSINDATTPKIVIADAVRKSEDWAQQAIEPIITGKAQKGSIFSRFRKETSRQPRLPENDTDLAYILFTSGTTGMPKGVKLTHGNIAANVETMTRLFGIDKKSIIFNDMILAHADGLAQGPFLTLFNGCRLVRAGGFTIGGMENWLNSVRRHRCTHFLTVPTIWSLIDRYATHNDYFDGDDMRLLFSVADFLPIALWDNIEERFGKPLINQYGLTETVTSAIYSGALPEMGPRGSLGNAIDCEARVRPLSDDAGAGDKGELMLRGENIFAGYWQNEEITNQVLDADGWLSTGDLVVQNPDGSFTYSGRLKSIIMTGGFLIQPEELNETLITHPDVAEAVTVGLPDTEFGEIAVSAIVLSGTEIERSILYNHCSEYLEPSKVPKHIIITKEIPRTISGKPKIQELKEQLATILETGSEPEITSDSDELAERIMALAADNFRTSIDQISLSTTPDDIAGWDSFSFLNLIIAVEESAKVRLPTRRITNIATIADLIDAVREQVDR